MDSDQDIEESDSGSEVEEELVEDGGATDRKHYTILTDERIRQRQENDISKVSTLLSLSRGLACTLLRLKNWSLASVFDDWFSDEESVRQLLGLLPEPEEPPKTDNNRCNICFEEVETENTISAHCGHPFCLDCWKTHLSASIQNGPACLSLRCPQPECKANPGPDMVDRLASDEEKQKYYGHILWSYVDGHRNLKWCPGPGCDLAIEFDAGERENLDITCDCSYSFCWNCMEENHRPVKCEIVEEWMKLITLEADDTPWILKFIKRCPKCRRRIEKHEGCTHMTCREPCGFQFCWLCLEPWSYGHVCNSSNYETRESLGGTRELVRYAHFLGRWASNHRSRETALLILQRARGELLETLKDVQKVPISDLGFVIEALEQIAECRRVLKWSYAYGYHLYPKAVWFRSTALDDFCEVRARVRFFNHMRECGSSFAASNLCCLFSRDCLCFQICPPPFECASSQILSYLPHMDHLVDSLASKFSLVDAESDLVAANPAMAAKPSGQPSDETNTQASSSWKQNLLLVGKVVVLGCSSF